MPVATMHSSCLHSLSLDHPEIVYWLANRWQASVSYQQRLVFAALSPQGTVLSSESALPPPPQRWLSYCHVGDSGVRRARQAYVHRVPLLGSAFFST